MANTSFLGQYYCLNRKKSIKTNDKYEKYHEYRYDWPLVCLLFQGVLH
jgi:hypothetical protein